VSRSTSEIRKVSSGLRPKLSPKSSPRIRMNSSGIPSNSPAATRSRTSSRSSFFASDQTAYTAHLPSVPQRPPRHLQQYPLEVGLLRPQPDQLDPGLVQKRHQLDQRPLDVGALQGERALVQLRKGAFRQHRQALAQPGR